MTRGARHLISVITWKPLAATTTATTAWLGLAARPSGLMLSTAAAAVAAATAHVLDDPAAATLRSSPTTLLRRRLHRIALAVPLLGVWWALAVTIVAQSTAHPPFAAPTLHFVTLVAIGLAGASAAAVGGDHARSGTSGALTVLVCFGTTFLPERSLQVVPIDPDATRRLTVFLALAVAINLGSSIDPARPRLPALLRRATRPAPSGL